MTDAVPTALDILPVLPAEPGMGGMQALDVGRAVRKRLEPHPVFKSNNSELFERTAKFVTDTVGQPINPSNYLDFLADRGIRLLDTPQNTVRVTQLFGKWSGKLKKYLENKEGIGGQWFVLPDGLTYAPDARDLRIATDAKNMVAGYKQMGTKSADQIRESIWSVPDPEPVREGLLPESELTPTQKKILAYMSHISVKNAVDYPSEEQLAERIAGATRSFTPEAVHHLFDGLMKEQFLFKYRKDGKDYVTTNANVAHAENMKRRPTKQRGREAVREVNAELAGDVMAMLLAAGNEKYTPKKLWSMLQPESTESMALEGEGEIKEIARLLARNGVILAGTFKPKEGGVTRSSKREGFRLGLDQKQREHLEAMTPKELSAYIVRNIG